MRWSIDARIGVVSLAFAAVIVLGLSGSAFGDFTFGWPRTVPFLQPGDGGPCFPSDGLEMYIVRDASPGTGTGDRDLWVLKRASRDDDWGPAENLGPLVNGPGEDSLPSISSDGLMLYYYSDGHGGQGSGAYVTTRPTKDSPWGPPVKLAFQHYGIPWISADDLELYLTSGSGYGLEDIHVSRRRTTSDAWPEPVNLGPVVNSAYSETVMSLSPDGLLLLFAERDSPYRPGGYGDGDIWMARRTSVSEPWQTPVNLGPKVNGSGWDWRPRISPDGKTLYCYETGGMQQAPIIPIVDFNADLKVDTKDLLILIEHWGQDYSPCDMGPMPWGDGKVDEKDLEVLMSYWGQELPDPNLVAHWKLDETEGDVAKDSSRTYDATLKGDPLWQPAGGKVDGAILMDGVGDYITTPSVLDPSAGPFSVFAWVKGGAPGQAVISQSGKADWLAATTPEGRLTTGLSLAGVAALTANVVITDGNWHLIGLVWDGTHRSLYVDNSLVGDDFVAGVPGAGTGLYVGVGSRRSASTFWSGLIDDVRVYDQAVKP